VLLNLRFVPMGIAIAPWLRHGAWLRAARGQALIDASWALSGRGDGRFDVDFLLGATAIQYPAWVLGTAVGALAGAAIGDPNALGLDSIFPAFFLGLLVAELRKPSAPRVALLGRHCGRPDSGGAGGGPDHRRRPGRDPGTPAVSAVVWVTVAGLAIATAGGHAKAITIDARVLGLAVAASALALRAPLYVVVIAAAAATAILRAIVS